MNVLAALLRMCERRHTRVFMATHSPLVLSLADHPLVQMVDMSSGWLSHSRKAMEVMASPIALTGLGAAVEDGLRTPPKKTAAQRKAERLAAKAWERPTLPGRRKRQQTTA